MSEYGTFTGMAKPEQGDEDWKGEINGNWTALDWLMAPTNCFFVSPAFSAANLGNGSAASRRHFDTIQGAITAREAQLGDVDAVIYIYPGVYNERLVVTKTVLLQGVARPGLYGHGQALITGDGTAVEVLQFAPQSAMQTRLGLSGLNFQNSYATTNAVEITRPIAIDVLKPTVYGPYPNILYIEGCHFRMQPLGNNNRWSYGIRLQTGWTALYMKSSQFGAYNGPLAYGLIRDVLHVRGDYSNGKASLLYLRRVEGVQYRITGQTMSIFNADGGVIGIVDRSSFSGTISETRILGATGTNIIAGLTSDAEAASFMNLTSRTLAWF